MLHSDARRFLVRLACFAPLAALPVLTNWAWLQPGVQRAAMRRLDSVVVPLLHGAPFWTSSDMRFLKAACLDRLPAAPEILILGGSRGLPISAGWFRPHTAFNLAVLAGDLDDMIATFRFCLEAGRVPRTVLVEINPMLRRAIRIGDLPAIRPAPRDALRGLFSMEQFALHIRVLLSPTHDIYPQARPHTYRLFAGGEAVYETEESDGPSRQAAEVVAALNRLDSDERAWRTQSTPHDADVVLLRSFLDDLQAHGIRVVVLLAPVSPIAYPIFRAMGGYDESWIRREMSARGIAVAGTYSPVDAGATAADFFDDVHPRPAILRRLLSRAGLTPEP